LINNRSETEEMLDLVANFFNHATHFLMMEERPMPGGYFCLADTVNGRPWFICSFGIMLEEKWPRYLHFAQEKALRLAVNPSHESSWQSRNEEEEQWGGAIRAGQYILSFSGLPEKWDEALCLAVAFTHQLINMDEAIAIADLKRTPSPLEEFSKLIRRERIQS